MKLKGNILEYIEKQSSFGIILLDESLQVIYRNPKAEEVLGKMAIENHDSTQNRQFYLQILKDCGELKEDLANRPSGGITIPKERVVSGPNNTRFSVKLRVLDQEPGWEGFRLFMVSIEEQSNANFNKEDLIETFHLSKREMDVVSLLFKGLKNAQIAKELFVSEVTVKKHLQNIYEKVGVKNRTSLINRILTS